MHDVSRETTGELMRLEDALLEAARAAKQAVSVRRRLRTMSGGPGGGDGSGARRAPAADGAKSRGEPDKVRDFVDEHRVEWRVWEVVPTQGRATRAGPQFGAFQAGWLAFEAVGTGQRRRLRDYPRDWNRLSNEALEALLARAEVARNARRSSPSPSSPTGERRDEPQQ